MRQDREARIPTSYVPFESELVVASQLDATPDSLAHVGSARSELVVASQLDDTPEPLAHVGSARSELVVASQLDDTPEPLAHLGSARSDPIMEAKFLDRILESISDSNQPTGPQLALDQLRAPEQLTGLLRAVAQRRARDRILESIPDSDQQPTGPQLAADQLRASEQLTGFQRAVAQRRARFDQEKWQLSVSPPGSVMSTDERSQASTEPATTHNVNDHAAHYFAEKPFDNLLPGSDKHTVTLDRRMSSFETNVNYKMAPMIALVSGTTELTSEANGRRTEVTAPLIQAVISSFDNIASEAMLLSGINANLHETGRLSSSCFFLVRNNPMAGVTAKSDLPHFALKTKTTFETLLCSFLDTAFVQSAKLFESTAKLGLISALLQISHNKQKHSVQHSNAKQNDAA
jgi:hypothetical protein